MPVRRREFVQSGIAAGLAAVLARMRAFAGPADLVRKAIPASGEEVPVVGLGALRFGSGATARAPLEYALRRFRELGGTVIDTAPMYGSSESVVGDLLSALDFGNEAFIATKTDRSEGGTATARQMTASAATLGTETLDLVQVHNLMGWRDALPVMREWQQDGRVRYIGITTSRTEQYGDFESVMRAERLDFIQVNYSLDQQTAADRILPLAADLGIAVMLNRPFGGGRLFETLGDAPLPGWAHDFGAVSWAQFLLKYAVSHPAATVAIPGMTKARHVEDNLAAARGRLPDASERKRMEAYFAAL